MKILVCGSRVWQDYNTICKVLDSIHLITTITIIINGGAKGADELGRRWAVEHDVPEWTFMADWAKHGVAAGPLRNQKMLVDSQPDGAAAFSEGPGLTRGTQDMVHRLTGAKVPTIVVVAPVRYDWPSIWEGVNGL